MLLGELRDRHALLPLRFDQFLERNQVLAGSPGTRAHFRSTPALVDAGADLLDQLSQALKLTNLLLAKLHVELPSLGTSSAP